MNTKRMKTVSLLLLILLLIVGCGSPESEMMESDSETSGSVANYADDSAESVVMEESQTFKTTASSGQRLIIKTGRMTLNVNDTDLAVANAIDLVLGSGGYIVSQNVHNYGDEYRAATLTLGVPVDRFESALKALRSYGDVESESASGQDVTEEYVDLNSNLENLQATQLRLREFLAASTNVEEALAVDNELRQVEGEINVIQGRIKYLADRAAFSTIELEISPIIAVPAPEPQSWQPAAVAQRAFVTLQDGIQNFVDGTIYFVIALLPWVLIWSAIAYIAYRIGARVYSRIRREPIVQAATSAEPSGD